MKITNKTLMVGFETEVKLGNNDAIELTLIHQAFISEDGIDIEIGVDIRDVKFLGIDVDSSYNGFKQFKASLKDLGIDLDKLIDEKATALFEDMNMEKNLQLLK